MLTTETGTQTRILAAAKTEFLEKGFRNASLRTIVKLAGVTTGAFYGYYSNKDGTIVESGTPEELMQKQNGLFRHMTELQKQSSVWEVGK